MVLPTAMSSPGASWEPPSREEKATLGMSALEVGYGEGMVLSSCHREAPDSRVAVLAH